MSPPTFVAPGPFGRGQQVTLGEADAHHIRVRRLDVGARVTLVDGQGARAHGVLVRVATRSACVEVGEAAHEPRPVPVHLLVPVADKERMLLVAEKAAELQAASWRPVVFRRSRSVAGRGEGPMFVRKVQARMTAALEQSGGAWLPVIYPDANVERAISGVPDGTRIVLSQAGRPLVAVAGVALRGEAGLSIASVTAPVAVTVVVGPEGGIEPDELGAFEAAGFMPAAIGRTTLRFETAAVAALGAVQSLLHAHGGD